MVGAVSYLLKTVPPDELVLSAKRIEGMLDAIRRTTGGEGILPPDLLIEVIAAQEKLTRSQGNKGTRRQGAGEVVSSSPHLLVSLSQEAVVRASEASWL